MTRLPHQPWQDSRGLRRVLQAMEAEAGATRLVGGAVRDSLLGLPVQDVDLATRFPPQEVIRRLEAAGIRAIPTGIDHGTVTAVSDHQSFEITTLRRDVSTDGRRATVAFTEDWKEDAARRDFTINALYANPLTGEIFDYFGGLEDLEARRVRFIGRPLERIAEDHLRILRFFRFHARFGRGAPDPESFEACVARANDLMALSRERIREEILRLLGTADPAPTVALMVRHGVFAPVLPELTAEGLAGLASLVAVERSLGDVCALRRLARLLPADAEVLDDIGRRLRLSNAERKRLVAMAERRFHIPTTRQQAEAAIYRLGAETFIDRMVLQLAVQVGAIGAAATPAAETEAAAQGADSLLHVVANWAAVARSYVPPRLPLSGNDLMALGVPRGPDIARTLGIVRERWIDAGFPEDREVVLGLARAVLADQPPQGEAPGFGAAS
ncbi:CCA tRNA nucleotidyltransferase [Pedomonas sp. V897]|uniref:CCA tRNA nucleotidyltransferase n=1 Tax=Pedomonas sp. V897 TaxID=3446482 RepID=UPI003EE0F13E